MSSDLFVERECQRRLRLFGQRDAVAPQGVVSPRRPAGHSAVSEGEL
jgi:hypothetical protein